ncbi:MAG: PEP-CTERM sorting domain-containing protein [Verrucomicrobiota bacterium]|nr:PEP-CTERM sorting domain-containing protein [Verrucomicrobiota bacterium]
MKYILPLLAACFVAVVESHAVVAVTLATGPTDRWFSTASDTPLSNGSLIRIGTFNGSVAEVNFVEWISSSTSAQPPIPPANAKPGRLTPGTINNSTNESFFDGKQIYLWVYNSASIGSATEQGLFTASSGWVFSTLTPTTIDLDSVNQNPLIAGTVIPGGVNAGIRLAAIPEPATYAGILGLGAVLVAFLRNRKAKR